MTVIIYINVESLIRPQKVKGPERSEEKGKRKKKKKGSKR